MRRRFNRTSFEKRTTLKMSRIASACRVSAGIGAFVLFVFVWFGGGERRMHVWRGIKMGVCLVIV